MEVDVVFLAREVFNLLLATCSSILHLDTIQKTLWNLWLKWLLEPSDTHEDRTYSHVIQPHVFHTWHRIFLQYRVQLPQLARNFAIAIFSSFKSDIVGVIVRSFWDNWYQTQNTPCPLPNFLSLCVDLLNHVDLAICSEGVLQIAEFQLPAGQVACPRAHTDSEAETDAKYRGRASRPAAQLHSPNRRVDLQHARLLYYQTGSIQSASQFRASQRFLFQVTTCCYAVFFQSLASQTPLLCLTYCFKCYERHRILLLLILFRL